MQTFDFNQRWVTFFWVFVFRAEMYDVPPTILVWSFELGLAVTFNVCKYISKTISNLENANFNFEHCLPCNISGIVPVGTVVICQCI